MHRDQRPIKLIRDGHYDHCPSDILTDIEAGYNGHFVDIGDSDSFLDLVRITLDNHHANKGTRLAVYRILGSDSRQHRFVLSNYARRLLYEKSLEMVVEMHDDLAGIVNNYRMCY